MPLPGTAERPLRVAIVGSGPSGFFCAEPLLQAHTPCQVDLFERLPTPFGLVRGGVAPDHARIRLAAKAFEPILNHPRFSFLGNVRVGADVSIAELGAHYEAIVFAYGAETDQRMAIPGEDLAGSHTATSFVGWYNAHPDYRDAHFDLSQEVAVVVGAGNVAIDVARILAKSIDELQHTDMAQHALDALAASKVKEIHLVARRGPAQAKFTLQELKEMGRLAECEAVVDDAELVLGSACEEEMKEWGTRRNVEVLRGFAEAPPQNKCKRLHFRFLLSPVELRGRRRVESITLEKNRLSGAPQEQEACGTGETVELPCGLVFRSIGYRGLPMPGLPFDEAVGVIPNAAGRVVEQGRVLEGLYVAGWIKRGPSGVIGTNKPDSLVTAEQILADCGSLRPCACPSTAAVRELLTARGVRVVDRADWRRIDAAEIARGKPLGKPRERFTRVGEMLAVLDG